jgi:hypothetical protein
MFLAVAARYSGRNHSLTARFVPKLASSAELGKPWVLQRGVSCDCRFPYENALKQDFPGFFLPV